MDLQKIRDLGRTKSLVFLENRVNGGSPSGFSNQDNVLREYAAGRLQPFKLLACRTDFSVVEYCSHSEFAISNVDSQAIIIHPLAFELLENNIKTNFYVYDTIEAYVTASGRTVLAVFENGESFVKLHFPEVLGRVYRHLPFRKAVAGVEISRLIEKLISSNEIKGIGLMPEIMCRGAVNDGLNNSISFVERLRHPLFSFGIDKESFLIPSFSMFAKNSDDSILIEQICEEFAINNVDSYYNVIIRPLIVAYLDLTFKEPLSKSQISSKALSPGAF